MRKLVAAAFLAVLFVGCSNLTHEDAVYEGFTTTDWIEKLHSEEVEVRQTAAQAMGELGPEEADSTVPALIEALKDSDTLVRLYSIRSLAKLGPIKARPASNALSKAMNDKDPHVVREAINLYRDIERARTSALRRS